MIVSFRHNFVFIKTHKTGGTSVELSLSPSCGPDDILTPLAIEDERARMVEGRVLARNFYGERWLENAYCKSVIDNNLVRHRRIARRTRQEGHFYNHMPAEQIAERLPARFWQSAFKFTVERHPYEKAVSMAYYRLALRNLSLDHFQEVLQQVIERGEMEESEAYSINGEIVVDLIMRQETLDDDFSAVCRRLGIQTAHGVLPRAKTGLRRDSRSASEILAEAQKNRIGDQCQRMMHLLDYRP